MKKATKKGMFIFLLVIALTWYVFSQANILSTPNTSQRTSTPTYSYMIVPH